MSVTSGEGRPQRTQAEKLRLAASFGLGALAVLFAALNLDDVRVNWIVATTDTPLIVVIVVCLVVGAGIGWILARRRAR